MAIFEKDKVDVREYLAILDAEGNIVGIFNPTSRKVPLELFEKAFKQKGINAEIRQSAEIPLEIKL